MKKHIVISLKNDIACDQRVLKVCNTLFKNNYQITIICTDDKLNFNTDLPYKIHKIKTHFHRGFLFFTEFSILLFFKLWKLSGKNILLANDLDTLLPNVLIKNYKGNFLIYDSHEIFTEMPQIKSNLIRHFWKKIERYSIKYVDKMYTVNESLCNWFLKEYNIQPEIIQNVPLLNEEITNDQVLDIKLPEKFIIYQGIVKEDRGIELMCKTMEIIEDYYFVIVGNGPDKQYFKNYSETLTAKSRILFIDKVSPENLHKITVKAALGISFESQQALSYQLALPNKFFDYIHAQIPVLATDLIEYKTIMKSYQVGEVLENLMPETIVNTFYKIMSNRENYILQCKKCKKAYNWQNQEVKLLNCFPM